MKSTLPVALVIGVLGLGAAAQSPTLSSTPVVSGCPTTVSVRGEALAPFLVAHDTGPGPVAVAGLGLVELDLGPDFGLFLDGVALDATGAFDLTLRIPALDPALLPTAPLHFQALVFESTGPRLSNGLAVQVTANAGHAFTPTPGLLPSENLLAEDALFADLDADGDEDLVIANSQSAMSGVFAGPRIWINQGEIQGGTLGDFADATAGHAPAFTNLASLCVAAGDVDRDGDLDLFVGADDRGSNAPNRLFLNQGGRQGGAIGSFLEDMTFPGGGFETRQAVFADLDGDGWPDLVCGNGTDVSTAPERNELFRNTGGAFSEVSSFATAGFNSASETDDVQVEDIDGDGHLDILLARDDTPLLLLGDGAFGFRDTSSNLGLGSMNASAAVVADFDGNGRTDIFLANIGDPDALRFQDAAGHFSAGSLPFAPTSFVHMDAVGGDFDADGDVDVCVSTHAFGGGELPFLYLNQGGAQGGTPGSFQVALLSAAPSEILATVATGDVDGDGDLDLFLGSQGFFGPFAQDVLLLGAACP